MHNNKLTQDWTYAAPKHNYQHDNFSCGLKVIRHMEAFFKNKTFYYTEKDEMVDRMELGSTILENSEPLNCIKCNNEEEEEAINVCKMCKRFAHLKCAVFEDICFNCQSYN